MRIPSVTEPCSSQFDKLGIGLRANNTVSVHALTGLTAGIHLRLRLANLSRPLTLPAQPSGGSNVRRCARPDRGLFPWGDTTGWIRRKAVIAFLLLSLEIKVDRQ
jgi:hypothetical protein